MIDLKSFDASPRLLVEATLAPLQGSRFQPTGFPDLGPAIYTIPGGLSMLIVESHQSMANRLESVCWDEGKGDLVAGLKGLPYVSVEIREGKKATATTSSLQEAHRLNSPYILQGRTAAGKEFSQIFTEECGYRSGRPVDRAKFIKAAFRFDPNTLLHGSFMSNLGDGRMRLARAVSCSIEARDVQSITSGGVKNDRVNASGDAKKGFGNVPFVRTEFSAGAITLFFNLDLEQIRSYGLADNATRVLILLSLFKLQKLLAGGLRLRTACDFGVQSVVVKTPAKTNLPALADLEQDLAIAIAACAGDFATPPITALSFTHTDSSSRVSKKAAQAAKAEAGAAAEEPGSDGEDAS